VPGDEIRGVVEEGRPVIYVNKKKIDEPYINRYPLIHLWMRDIASVQAEVERELASISRGLFVDERMVQELVLRKLGGYTTWRSYDPAASFTAQPFYRIEQDRIIRDDAGQMELLYPETPFLKADGRKLIRRADEFWNGSDEFFVRLRANEYWCMGDNRRGSKDCRTFGPINGKYIHGRILFQIFSIDSNESWWFVDLLKHPIDFWTRVRWNQLFKRVI
jgi:hypothetical protein